MLTGFMGDVIESKEGGISPKKLSKQLRMPVSGKGGLTSLVKRLLNSSPKRDWRASGRAAYLSKMKNILKSGWNFLIWTPFSGK